MVNSYAVAILIGLQNKSIYGGTVSWSEKQRRRAANRVARANRRKNRLTA